MGKANLETSIKAKIIKIGGVKGFRYVEIEADGKTYKLIPGDILELKANLNWEG